MIEAIIAAGVIVAWLAILVTHHWRDIMRPHHVRDQQRHQTMFVDGQGNRRTVNNEVIVTIRADAAKLRAAMARAGRSAREFDRALQQVNEALRTVSLRTVSPQLKRALADLDAGRVTTYETDEAFLASLDE